MHEERYAYLKPKVTNLRERTERTNQSTKRITSLGSEKAPARAEESRGMKNVNLSAKWEECLVLKLIFWSRDGDYIYKQLWRAFGTILMAKTSSRWVW